MIGQVGLTYSHTCDTLGCTWGERTQPCKHHSCLCRKDVLLSRGSSSARLPSPSSGLTTLPSFTTLQWLWHSVSSSNTRSRLGKSSLTLAAAPFAWKLWDQIFVRLARGVNWAVTSPEKPSWWFVLKYLLPGSFPSHFFCCCCFIFHSVYHHSKLHFSFNIFMCLLSVPPHILKWKLPQNMCLEQPCSLSLICNA